VLAKCCWVCTQERPNPSYFGNFRKCKNSHDFELFNGGSVYFELLTGKLIISSLLTMRTSDLEGENLVIFLLFDGEKWILLVLLVKICPGSCSGAEWIYELFKELPMPFILSKIARVWSWLCVVKEWRLIPKCLAEPNEALNGLNGSLCLLVRLILIPSMWTSIFNFRCQSRRSPRLSRTLKYMSELKCKWKLSQAFLYVKSPPLIYKRVIEYIEKCLEWSCGLSCGSLEKIESSSKS
jgi:hypothetical protein